MLRRLVLLSVIAMLFISIAPADEVTLHLVSATGGTVDGILAPPYNFTVNNDPTLIQLMCLSFDKESTIGTSWLANTVNVLDVSDLNDRQLYEIDSLLFAGIPDAGQYSLTDYQLAIWGLVNSDARNLPTYQTDNVAQLDQDAINLQASTGDQPFYGQFVLYFPEDGTNQIFIGNTADLPASTVPEPASMVLLGSGLLGLIGVARKRLS